MTPSSVLRALRQGRAGSFEPAGKTYVWGGAWNIGWEKPTTFFPQKGDDSSSVSAPAWSVSVWTMIRDAEQRAAMQRAAMAEARQHIDQAYERGKREGARENATT